MREPLKARVLDLTDESGVFCTKLLAAVGMDVIRVEPPGGDPTRRIGPFYHGKPHPEYSLHWFLHNLNKRGVTLEITTADGQALFKRLVQTADVVVECFRPGYLAGLGLGYDDLRAINPALIVTSITPFGQSGPYSDYKGSDMIACATSGMMYQSGAEDTPPVHASLALACQMTGAQAAVGTQFALYYRNRTGKGQHVDVSQQECTTWSQFPYHVAAKSQGAIIQRGGDTPWLPGTAKRKIYFKCADGYVAAYPTYWSHMPICLKWMKENGFAEAIERTGVESYNNTAGTTFPPGEVMDAVNDIFGQMAINFPKQYLFEEGQTRGMQVAPISSLDQIFDDRHLRARNYFAEIDHAELGEKITYPGPPFRLKGVEIGYHRRAPFIGEHNDEIYRAELGLTADDLERLKQANAI